MIVVLGDVIGPARIVHQADQALERVALVDPLLAQVTAQRLANVECLGAASAGGEPFQCPLGGFIEIELLPPHTQKYTSSSRRCRCDHCDVTLARLRALLEARGTLTGLLASAGAVAAVTALIEGLKHFIPVLSLGALYVFAVLPIAVVSGLAFAVAVSVASMLAFNFFFLEPVHTFTLADSSNWFALAVFLVTAIVVSELAARSRRRAQEASLLAEVATSLLEHGSVGDELERISAQAARALQVERALITLGSQPRDGHALSAGGRRVGTIRRARH
jgi:hypothetical protein